MDPYSFHQLQQAGAFDDSSETEAVDLLDLILEKFLETTQGIQVAQTSAPRRALLDFLEFGRHYLRANPPVGQGIREGGMTLILQGGESVPVVLAAPVAPMREAPTYAITQPRETHRRGMQGGANSGAIGVTGRSR